MNIEDFRDYALSLPHVEERLPFDDDTLCFVIHDKMFALVSFSNPTFANLKCDPERAIHLRETYNGISPGWHMNKKHWNSVFFHSDVPNELFHELIQHAYECTAQKLPKSIRSKYSLTE